MSNNKKKTVKELNAEFELLAERVKKLEEKDASEDPGKVQEKLNGIEEILKSYDKKIGDLDRELLQARQDNNIEKGKDSKRIDGEVCNKTLKDKPNLMEHIKPMHPKTYECENCDETFTESWKMEEHLEHHGNERPFKCSICEKGFYMKWRMEKHTRDHRVDIKFCHYFNNDKPCPYDKIGCKFKHEISPECRYNLKCTFKLCQFTHTTKKGEELVHGQELETHNEGVVETRGQLLPAIISTDRTIAHREFMKPLEDAKTKSSGAVEMNEENDCEDSESFLADMENMDNVDSESSYISDEDSDSSDSDSSDEEETDPNMYGVERLLQKCQERMHRGKGNSDGC